MSRSARAVIKAGDTRMTTRGMYALDFRDIESEAAARLEAARVEADRIVSEARAAAQSQSELIRQTAHREGHESGLARGQASGHAAALEEARSRFAQDHESLAKALTEALAAFSTRREQLFLEARRDVVVLAIAIASRVFERMSAEDSALSEATAAALREALELIGSATQAQVRVHADELAALERLSPEALQGAMDKRHVQFVVDASIERGGVLVATAESTVDATVATRVERVASELVSDWRDRMSKLGLTQ